MRDLEELEVSNEPLRRNHGFEPTAYTGMSLSWGGIIAGVFAAIALQLLLNLLGIGVGASSINAAQGDQPGQGMAIGAVIWFVLSWVLSLAIGAWVACQFAPHGDRRKGALQGFVVWCVASLVVVYLLSTAAGNMIGGTASVIGRTASLVGSGAKSSAPGVAGLVSHVTGITPGDITSQAGQIASDPQLQQIVSDAVRNGNFSDADRQSLASLLAQRGHMSTEQANQTIDKWQAEIQAGAQNAKQTAIKVEDKAATGVSATGFGSFVSLLLGLFAAVAGGILGTSPRFTTYRAARATA